MWGKATLQEHKVFITLLEDDRMDAGGRATQDAKAENNYKTKALPRLNTKHSAAKMNSKDQHALTFDIRTTSPN